MGEMGTYQMLMNGEEGIGGIVPLDENVPVPSHWIGYVTVDDVDAALERALQRLPADRFERAADLAAALEGQG